MGEPLIPDRSRVHVGGPGNDSFWVTDPLDRIVEQEGAGTDTVWSPFDWTLGAHLENLHLLIDFESPSPRAAVRGTGNALDNEIVGNFYDNLLDGQDGNDSLFGGPGNDHLIGGNGNDRLDGGTGADLLEGGAGDDVYGVDDPGDQVVEAADAGTDTVVTSIDYTLGANLENLRLTGSAKTGIGNASDNLLVAGDKGAHLLGLGGDDFLQGGAGNDTLEGGAGNDTLAGGKGNDLLLGGAGDDRYLYARGDGHDTIDDREGRGTLEFGAGIRRDQLGFTRLGQDLIVSLVPDASGVGGSITVRGWFGAGERINRAVFSDGSTMALDDSLFGGVQRVGGFWSDTLEGTAFSDRLDGGRGADRLRGGKGDDLYIVDNALDRLVDGPGEGQDTVVASLSWTLSDALENLQLTGFGFAGTGNARANVLVGNSGDSWLQGLAGNDLLVGRGGRDTLWGGADDDQLFGNGGNDRLYGEAGRDRLWGGDGDDWLEGGAGDDVLAGGRGDDTIVAGPGRDLITFDRGDGKDLIVSTPGDAGMDTLRLGGYHLYDITLLANGNDLVLWLRDGDQITLQNWFGSSAVRSIGELQVVTSPGEVQRVDFLAVAAQIDQQRAANPRVSAWGPFDLGDPPAPAPADASNAPAAVDPWGALQAGTLLAARQPLPATADGATLVTSVGSVDALLFAALQIAPARPDWVTPART